MTGNGNHTGEYTTLPGADAVQDSPLTVIAEEQPAIRELLCWMLLLAGYRLVVCVDRQATLTWEGQITIPADLRAILLLDLGSLCAQEAINLLDNVRAQWQTSFTVPPQIIILTTHPNVQTYLGSRECVLLKPFHVRDLLALIQQATKAL